VAVRALKVDRGSGSLDRMPTLVRDPQPAEFEAMLERRRRLGQDRFDEVWEGVYHLNPAPSHEHERLVALLIRLLGPFADQAQLELTGGINLGDERDWRIPDVALHQPGAPDMWHPTAALVVEVISPNDESWDKLDFYAAHKVDELLIVDPQERRVQWFGFRDGRYQPIERSGLLDLGPGEVEQRLEWP
jgi:Uma2 family endonuclease